MQGKCIIFSAPSGAGKTTLIKRLIDIPELKLEFSISATTRKPRGTEVHGKDYYFLDADVFRNKIEQGALVEWEEVYANYYYGTLEDELHRIWEKKNNVAFDVDVKGGLQLKKLFGDQALSVFVAPPSVEILEQRLRGRGTEDEDTIRIRLQRAEFELSLAPQFDIQIVNDNLNASTDEAYQKILHFINRF